MKVKENYAGAILIAWKLYYKFIKEISFNEFEKLITSNYDVLNNEVNTYK